MHMPTDVQSKRPSSFDPDEYRMTIGEHLEELRTRLILGLAGFIVVLLLCLVFAKSYVVPAFCKPLIDVLQSYDINPQLVTGDVSEGFMVFIQISLISAGALASPWMVYQLWQFVAAGLYPNERKYVTRYLPLSIGLLISGMLLVYFIVLPWTLQFLIGFSIGIPLPTGSTALVTPSVEASNFSVPALGGDPEKPVPYQMWFDTHEQRLKMFVGGQVRAIPFGSSELLRPEITLGNYIDTVVAMLLAFGLSFQLPLVILALERIGIVELDTLKRGRRYAIFIMAIAAAAITPGTDIASMMGLMVPLILLYELGIFLARRPKKPLAGDGMPKDDQ
jgi:sec-independent protein translocase protein TatC